MCRLFGFVGTETTKLDCSLVEAQNALQAQSDRDQRGIRNPDGWGIASWDSGGPLIIKSTFPAFADLEFAPIARQVWSKAVIAHVRKATVGAISEPNTHPFEHGPWVFAHNGTIPHLDYVATRLDLGPYGPPVGETDSELAFRWLLNRMADFGLDPESPADDVEQLVELLSDSVLELVRLTIHAGLEPPRLNFLLSDGRHLAATRWGNSLYWTHRQSVPDCAICGQDHCPQADQSYRATLVASEPITGEHWTEVPEGSVIGVGPEADTIIRTLAPAS